MKSFNCLWIWSHSIMYTKENDTRVLAREKEYLQNYRSNLSKQLIGKSGHRLFYVSSKQEIVKGNDHLEVYSSIFSPKNFNSWRFTRFCTWPNLIPSVYKRSSLCVRHCSFYTSDRWHYCFDTLFLSCYYPTWER